MAKEAPIDVMDSFIFALQVRRDALKLNWNLIRGGDGFRIVYFTSFVDYPTLLVGWRALEKANQFLECPTPPLNDLFLFVVRLL